MQISFYHFNYNEKYIHFSIRSIIFGVLCTIPAIQSQWTLQFILQANAKHRFAKAHLAVLNIRATSKGEVEPGGV